MSLIKLCELIAGIDANNVATGERAFCKDVLLAAAARFFPDQQSGLVDSLTDESVLLDPFLDECQTRVDTGLESEQSVMARKIEGARQQFVYRFKELTGLVLGMHYVYGMDIVAPTDVDMTKRIEFENAVVVWETWFRVSRMSRIAQDRYLVAILTRHIPDMREKQHRGETDMGAYLLQYTDLVHGLSGQELTPAMIDTLWNDARQFALHDRPVSRVFSV